MKIALLVLGSLLAAGAGYGFGSLHAGTLEWVPILEEGMEFCQDLMRQQGCFEDCSAALASEDVTP